MRSLLGSIINKSPVPLAERTSGRGMAGSWLMPRSGGMVTQMETMGTVGTVYAIVNRISTSTAKTCWKLWIKAASGLKEDRIEVMPGQHGALDLWNEPNKFMTQRQLVEAFSQHKELTGEGNIVIGKVGKLPVELWPIRPDRLEPVPDPYKFLLNWIYTGPSGDRVPLGTDELLRAITPNPMDPYRGMGPVQAILLDLDASRLSQQYQKNFYTNSARPGGIIEVPTMLGDDDFNQLRDRWAEQHQGVSKAHRVAILEVGKWIETQVSQRDMQMVEMANVSRDKVLEAWGFPKFALGMVEDVNRATAEASDYFYGKWLVEDRLDAIKDMLNSQLLPLYGKDQSRKYEFDYESPVPENQEAELAGLAAKSAAVALLAGAGFDVTEAEAWLNMPEIPFERPVVSAPRSQTPPDPMAAEQHLLDEPGMHNRIDLAMRWVVDAHIDDNVCEPCRENDGAVYRNRASAYEDYPNGQGYKNCVGAKYGNSCRCKVVKRRKSS